MNLVFYEQLLQELKGANAQLVAVSKTKTVIEVQALYHAGQRAFAENYVQELVQKQSQLPVDVQWHFIGHLQRNKVKQIAPFVSLIHAVDSERLLAEIDKEAAANARVIRVLLQLHVGEEETKFGLKEDELHALATTSLQYKHVSVCGLMTMASNTDDAVKVEAEFAAAHRTFKHLQHTVFQNQPQFRELSMGMSGDYKLALRQGATMVRIGSLIFGERI